MLIEVQWRNSAAKRSFEEVVEKDLVPELADLDEESYHQELGQQTSKHSRKRPFWCICEENRRFGEKDADFGLANRRRKDGIGSDIIKSYAKDSNSYGKQAQYDKECFILVYSEK